jgi:anti-sigma B factor antagonist
MTINFDLIKVSPLDHNKVDYTTAIFKLALPNEFIIDNSMYYEIFLYTLIGGGALKIYVNMQNVNYIDSSGIGILINGTKKIRDNRGELILSNLSHDVKKIFNLINLGSFLKIFNTEPEAINFFRYL